MNATKAHPAGPTDSETEPRGGLLRVLGIAFGLAVIIGNTIGAGILRTPGAIAERLPTPTLFLAVWLIAGLYALLGAVSLAELGTMIPRSGGQYVFVRRALGAYPGFVTGWSDWVATCGSAAAISIVIGEYVGPLVPFLDGRHSLTAASLLIAFALLQWRGVRIGDATQQLTSLLKTLALLAVIAAILLLPGAAQADVAAPPVPGGLALAAAFVASLQFAIYTYDGWTGVLYFGEEVRDPARDIPRSMLGGVLLVIAIYVLLNIGFLRVLPVGRMAGDPFVAGTAASAVFGPHGDTVIRVLMIVSLLAAANACQLIASRVPFAMSRDGLLPVAMSRVNRGGTPAPALWLGTAVALLFVASDSVETVLALVAFFFVANYALSFLSVFVLRRREPTAPRPFRAWGHPWTTGVALAGSIALLIASVVSDPSSGLRALLLLALSLPVFLAVRRRA